MAKKNRKSVNVCSVGSCEREIVYKEAELCAACYSGMAYWGLKTPTEMIKRQKQLIVLEERMELISGNRSK